MASEKKLLAHALKIICRLRLFFPPSDLTESPFKLNSSPISVIMNPPVPQKLLEMGPL